MIYKSFIKEYDSLKEEFSNIANKVFQELDIPSKNFSLNIVIPKKIQFLNKKYFNMDIPTDVIALEYKGDVSALPYLGDIFICPKVIYRNSVVYNVEFMDEMRRTFIHGLLHIIGIDHKKPLNNKEKMFKIQEKILKEIK